MLPLSHDEVVHGKGPLIDKMPGDQWQKFANLRALYAYMYAHPGTKLLFMGGEFAQTQEWRHEQSLDWHLNQYAPHGSMQYMVKRLNELYQSEPALYEKPFTGEGFEWIDISDAQNSVISFVRKGHQEQNDVLCGDEPHAAGAQQLPARGAAQRLAAHFVQLRRPRILG